MDHKIVTDHRVMVVHYVKQSFYTLDIIFSTTMVFMIEQQQGSYYIFRTLTIMRRLQFDFVIISTMQFINLQIAIFEMCITDSQCMISNGINSNSIIIFSTIQII